MNTDKRKYDLIFSLGVFGYVFAISCIVIL